MSTEATQPVPSAVKPRIIQPPPRDSTAKGYISFHHPHYRFPTGLLLSLVRFDEEILQDVLVSGVHHETALIACQIIAGNIFHTGYLALDQAGQQRIDTPLDGLLTENVYFFIIQGNDKYPIVPSFRDWSFPHHGLPDIWTTNPVSQLPGSRPNTCAITGDSYAIDRAHIIPREEDSWYNNVGMPYYGGDINNPTNFLPLRKDLRKCFDDRWFVIIPKRPGNTSQHKYMTHILPASAADIWPTYQNIIVQGLCQNSNAYLFARFAWAIFQQVKLFMTTGFDRNVIRFEWDQCNTSTSYKEETLEGSQLKALYGGGGSKSATPMKRNFREAFEDIEGSVYENSVGYSGSDVDAEEFWDGKTGEIGGNMGSKRREQSSSETLPEEVYGELKTSATALVTSQHTREASIE
ncbi:hypothetical protein J3F83DRAFT_563379 [Trichoderma novae-zelandiae]